MNPTLSSASPEAIGQELIQQAHNRDGIPEIGAGLFFLIASGLIWAQSNLPQDSSWFKPAVLGFAIGMPALLLLGKHMFLPWFRQRYFIESFGYVKHNRWTMQRLVAGLAFLAAFSLLTFGATPLMDDPERWGPLLMALLIATALMWWGKPRRFLLYGGITAAAAIGLAVAGTRAPASYVVLYSAIGCCFLLGGLRALSRFLREHRAGQ